MIAFELWTCAGATTRVGKGLWWLRAALYLIIALPGLLFSDTLMPPTLPSVASLLVAMINFTAAAAADLPKEKEWSWKVFGDRARDQKKTEEAGGKYVTFWEWLLALPFETYRDTQQKSLLPRRMFLVVYTVLNLVLWCARPRSPSPATLNGPAP